MNAEDIKTKTITLTSKTYEGIKITEELSYEDFDEDIMKQIQDILIKEINNNERRHICR